MPHGFRADSAEAQFVPVLLEITGLVANRPNPSGTVPFPVEDLSAGQRLIEVDSSCREPLDARPGSRFLQADGH